MFQVSSVRRDTLRRLTAIVGAAVEAAASGGFAVGPQRYPPCAQGGSSGRREHGGRTGRMVTQTTVDRKDALRILMLLANRFPPDIRVENEAASLLQAGHEVHLLCKSDDRFAAEVPDVLRDLVVHTVTPRRELTWLEAPSPKCLLPMVPRR